MLIYLGGILGSIAGLSRGREGGYVRTRRYSSKRFPERTYKTTDEFWRDHFDPVGAQVARQIERQGYVLNKKCYLEADGKILVQEKHYLSRAQFEISEQVKARVAAPDYLHEVSVHERTHS